METTLKEYRKIIEGERLIDVLSDSLCIKQSPFGLTVYLNNDGYVFSVFKNSSADFIGCYRDTRGGENMGGYFVEIKDIEHFKDIVNDFFSRKRSN